MLKIYLPKTIENWYRQNEAEGTAMFLAAVHTMAMQFGEHVYQEWRLQDIKSLMHDWNEPLLNKQLNTLYDQGILEWMRPVDNFQECFRFSKEYWVQRYGSRYMFEVELSTEGSLIWAYFLGRVANILEQSFGGDGVTPCEVERYAYRFNIPKKKKGPKSKEIPEYQLKHVLPVVYRDVFKNQIKRQPRANEV